MNSSDPANPVSTVSAEERAQLLRLAYRFCWNAEDAEDALQTALLTATQKSAQLRDRTRRWPWLCRVVVQHCRLLGRQQRAAIPRGVWYRRSAADAREPFSDEELGELMRRLLVELPPQQRVALTLRHLEEMNYDQISRIMEVSQSTARAHVHAGRETLRRLILARHPEWRV